MSELQRLRDEIAQLQTALTIKNGTIEQLKARVAELQHAPCECGAPVGYVSGDKYTAEHERLRDCRNERDQLRKRVAELEAQKVVMPVRMQTKAFTTIDRGSKNYKAGCNGALNEVGRLNPPQANSQEGK